MPAINKYSSILIPFLALYILVSGCKREPVVDHESDADITVSQYQNGVIQLDTMVFTNPVLTNGQVRFDLIGELPLIKAGQIIYYPSGDGIYGKVVSATIIGSRMVLLLDKLPINQIFKSFSIQDSVSSTVLKSRLRTYAPFWNSDTLNLKDFSLYNSDWQLKSLSVHFASGKFHSEASVGQFFMSGQGSDPWFDRCRLDFNYSCNIDAELIITTEGSMNAADSTLIETSTYGPYLVNGFPVIYKIDTWLGFHAVTKRDTTLTLKFSGISKGNLSLNYNYWDAWKIVQNNLEQSADINSYHGPRITSYQGEVYVSQVITPYFCGEASVSLMNRFCASISSEVDLPDWQSKQTISTRGTMSQSGQALNSFVPVRMDVNETLLYSESQSGVIENQAPVAVFSINPPAGFTDTNFEFNASASSDIESAASELLVRWDFDGDNHYDTEFSTEKIAFKKFPVPGIYQAVLEVKDPDGLTSRKVLSIEVSLSSSAPIAYFTVTPESGRVSNVFVFDASGCYDAEDGITKLKVHWDFDGDGVWDQPWSNNKAAFYVYSLPGKYIVKLEVLDTGGLLGSTTRIVTVAPINIKPTAFFTFDPASGTTATNFNFDASGSSDPEDSVEDLKVRWDWENDGVFDTEYTTNKTVQHIFATAGTHTVALEVLDTEGFGSTVTRQITVVNQNTPPTADFTISPTAGEVGTLMTFDASSSTDADDSTDLLEVRWDFDNDNVYDTEFTTEKVFKRTFDQKGAYIIKVQVRDTGGLMDSRVRLLVID